MKDVLKRGKIQSQQELCDTRFGDTLTEWRYLQLKHFISSLPHPIREESELTFIEQLCNTPKETGHKIAKIYGGLEGLEVEVPTYIEKWEQELGKTLTIEQKNTVLRAAQGYARDINTIEMSYKCLARWYLTPIRMQKINREEQSKCWRGCGEEGTMAHIWWACPKIRLYWQEIRQIISKVTNEEVDDDPWSCLFHVNTKKGKKYKNSLIPQLLNAAKGIIPKKWRETASPTIREWVQRVDYIQNMEDLIRKENPDRDYLWVKWDPWKEFKKTLDYIEIGA